MTSIILAFVLGMIFGVSFLVIICCAVASKEKDQPLDKEDWKEIP